MRNTLFCMLLAACTTSTSANNVIVSNVSLTNQNTTTNTWQVKFDVSWANSWRTNTIESNWDAAWIFIKFRIVSGYTYQHAILNAAGHVTATGATLSVPTDLRGAFIYRNANGVGNVNYTNVELQWNYGASGVADGDPVAVSVQAIEMVYSPQGAFWVGDGTGADNAFNPGIATGSAFQITSENQLTLGGISSSNLCANNNGQDDFNNSTTQILPAAFPKGFQAFYAMKYEMSQGQYADFLNKLTIAQAAARFPNANGTAGHTISNTGTAPSLYVASAPDRACNWIDFVDLAAYADWAALRPLTELEYEKLCRGDRPVVQGEYAWGNAFIHGSTPYTLANSGLPNETVTDPETGVQGNAQHNGGSPLRNGVFAASVVSPTQANAGAGYTGALELTGNVWEIFIWTGNATGRAFTVAMGDGNLAANGAANVAAWTAMTTLVVRGGSFFSSSRPVSMRSVQISLGTGNSIGGRLCRTL